MHDMSKPLFTIIPTGNIRWPLILRMRMFHFAVGYFAKVDKRGHNDTLRYKKVIPRWYQFFDGDTKAQLLNCWKKKVSFFENTFIKLLLSAKTQKSIEILYAMPINRRCGWFFEKVSPLSQIKTVKWPQKVGQVINYPIWERVRYCTGLFPFNRLLILLLL